MAKKIISRKSAIAKGLKRYFTGRPCPHGHISQRFVSSCGCVECTASGTKAWFNDNPLYMRDWLRNFRKRNPDYYPNWFRSNADSKRVASRRWYLKNAERSIAYTLNWRKSNMARFKSTRIEYVKNNSELIRAYSSNRRALKKASGSHTAQDIRALLEKQKFLCVGCSVSVKSKYHVDHKKPLSRGGSNRAFNLQILCPSCNLRKRDKDFTVWAREVGLRT